MAIHDRYKAWNDRYQSTKKVANYLLPGLSYTREQLFFISYAQSWARGIKPEEAIRRIRVDPHSPTSYRVIGPLSNDLNFMKAFNCKAGDAMSRVDKCQVSLSVAPGIPLHNDPQLILISHPRFGKLGCRL